MSAHVTFAPLRMLRVLVVEDHDDQRDLLVMILERYGGAKVVSATPRLARTVLAASGLPDVAVVALANDDVGVLRFLACASHLCGRRVAVVGVSWADAARRGDVDVAITKPVSPVDLVDAVLSAAYGSATYGHA